LDGSVSLGTKPLVNGVATLSTSALGVGVHGMTVVYSGDGVRFSGSRPDPQHSTIATVAGDGTRGVSGDRGLAPSAAINFPNAVAVDAAGNLYIADTNNSWVRRVDHATGVITTVAGGVYITGVAVDTSGNLFIVEEGKARVRRVDHATGVITTVAGNG